MSSCIRDISSLNVTGRKSILLLDYKPWNWLILQHRGPGACRPRTASLRHMRVTSAESRVVANGPIRSRLARGLETKQIQGGACLSNPSGDRWHPNHCAELVSRIRDREWLTRDLKA
jgi:hypothetical protein